MKLMCKASRDLVAFTICCKTKYNFKGFYIYNVDT